MFLYMNGTQRASSSNIPNWDNVAFESIAIGNTFNNTGSDNSSTFNGEISQVHISKKALYWNAFTPSRDLYPADITSSLFFLGPNADDLVSGTNLDVSSPGVTRSAFYF